MTSALKSCLNDAPCEDNFLRAISTGKNCLKSNLMDSDSVRALTEEKMKAFPSTQSERCLKVIPISECTLISFYFIVCLVLLSV